MPSEPEQFLFVPPGRVRVGPLVCRRVRAEDEGPLYESVVTSLDHLRPWMPWADGYDKRAERDFIERSTRVPEDEPVDDAPFLVCHEDGRVLGLCGLHARLGVGELEIGYWVDVRHTRRGVATLAAAALTDIALSLPDVRAVEIHHDAANTASGAIPRRLGYHHTATIEVERTAPAETGVEWQWRMTRDAWAASSGATLLAAAAGPQVASVDPPPQDHPAGMA